MLWTCPTRSALKVLLAEIAGVQPETLLIFIKEGLRIGGKFTVHNDGLSPVKHKLPMFRCQQETWTQ